MISIPQSGQHGSVGQLLAFAFLILIIGFVLENCLFSASITNDNNIYYLCAFPGTQIVENHALVTSFLFAFHLLSSSTWPLSFSGVILLK